MVLGEYISDLGFLFSFFFFYSYSFDYEHEFFIIVIAGFIDTSHGVQLIAKGLWLYHQL